MDPARELRDEQDRATRLQRIEDARPRITPNAEPDLRADPADVDDPQAVPLARLVVEDSQGLLKADDIDALLAPYRALPTGSARLSLLVRQLQAALVTQGWITSQARAERVDWPAGEVALKLVPGRLQDIRMADGQDVPAGLRRAFSLSSGDIIRLSDVEQGVRQINRLRRLQAKLRIEPTAGVRDRHDLVIDLQRQGSVWGQVSVDNHGARSTGEPRFKSSVFADDLLGALDATGLVYAHTAKTRALLVSSSVPQGRNTWSVGASASESSQPVLEAFRLQGRSSSLSLGWSRVLVLTAHREDTLAASFSHNASQRTFEGAPLQPERLSVARVAYANTWRGAAAQGYTELAYARGLRGLGARPDAPGLNDADAHAQFGKAELHLAWQWSPSRTWASRTTFDGQYARRGLYAGERFYLGGVNTVRGFEEGSTGGDRGWLLRQEWQRSSTPLAGDDYTGSTGTASTIHVSQAPFLFIDAGRARPVGGTSAAFTSAGLGWRANAGPARLEVVAGKPLQAQGHATAPERDPYRPHVHAQLTVDW